jgi:hypothetical protein
MKSGRNKVTSPKIAKLGSKELRSKTNSMTTKRLAGTAVSQAAGKSTKK